jgi:hypothetical protein
MFEEFDVLRVLKFEELDVKRVLMHEEFGCVKSSCYLRTLRTLSIKTRCSLCSNLVVVPFDVAYPTFNPA